jgi:hypothetical protein
LCGLGFFTLAKATFQGTVAAIVTASEATRLIDPAAFLRAGRAGAFDDERTDQPGIAFDCRGVKNAARLILCSA